MTWQIWNTADTKVKSSIWVFVCMWVCTYIYICVCIIYVCVCVYTDTHMNSDIALGWEGHGWIDVIWGDQSDHCQYLFSFYYMPGTVEKVLYVYYVILITVLLSPTLEMRKLRHRVTLPEVTQLSIVSENVLAGRWALNVHWRHPW